MADVTTGCTFKRLIPGALIKVETAATADNADVFTMTLADYGMATVEAVLGFQHGTTDSIITTEAPTTAVSAGVLTVTVGGSTGDKKRVFLIFGESP